MLESFWWVFFIPTDLLSCHATIYVIHNYDFQTVVGTVKGSEELFFRGILISDPHTFLIRNLHPQIQSQTLALITVTVLIRFGSKIDNIQQVRLPYNKNFVFNYDSLYS
ncbi:hypothetical protein Hanom_Chr10g00948251 [Helianthus anomalus]